MNVRERLAKKVHGFIKRVDGATVSEIREEFSSYNADFLKEILKEMIKRDTIRMESGIVVIGARDTDAPLFDDRALSMAPPRLTNEKRWNRLPGSFRG